jgi:hypothetical protein
MTNSKRDIKIISKDSFREHGFDSEIDSESIRVSVDIRVDFERFMTVTSYSVGH